MTAWPPHEPGAPWPVVHQMRGGGEGAVADLVVQHHSPAVCGDLRPPVTAFRRRWQRGGVEVVGQLKRARIVTGTLLAEGLAGVVDHLIVLLWFVGRCRVKLAPCGVRSKGLWPNVRGAVSNTVR